MAAIEERGTEMAVEVRGAYRSYGSLSVLKGLNMDVPNGCIYGLLGASGCGKTTLLKCIIGRLQLSEGSVRVLGHPPGARGHSIPGKDVGYMPQDLALFGDFTMLETMYYFGTLFGMSPKKVRERGKFLLELLELPSVTKTIKKLSGGQQRRVSFAVAMLQEPPLLILDEPTVGVDPLLRAKIWEHLLELVQRTKTTIIITTHYIEEARQAHVVGLMRNGLLLAQSPPDDLIKTHSMTTLEEVFLRLCREQDTRDRPSSQLSIQNSYTALNGGDEDLDEETPLLKPKRNNKASWTSNAKKILRSMCECDPINPSTILPRPRSIAALCWKNFTRIYRNPGLLIFQFLLPAFQIVLFCLAIGGNFSGVNVAIVNSDKGVNFSDTSYVGQYIPKKCTPFEDMNNFGSLFVSKLDDKSLDITYYDSMTDAVDAVKKGKAWMAIVIPKSFTQNMLERISRIIYLDDIPDDVINGSTIEIYEDVTDLQMTYTLQNKTTAASELFLEAFIDNCNVSKKDLSPPLQVHNPPVYGSLHLSYTDYVAPGMIVSITFGMSIGLTALSFVVERKEGLLDRTWVAGVNVTEMVLAQILTQCIILFVQSTILIILVRFAFKVYMVHLRSIFLVELLTMLQGLTGMAYGLLISSLCQQETSAMQIMAGSVYPVLLMSGIIWPLEGMPKFLRYISYALPTTYAAEAMRSIMGRGWGLADMFVWRGFTITIGWFILFGVLATLGLRLRK